MNSLLRGHAVAVYLLKLRTCLTRFEFFTMVMPTLPWTNLPEIENVLNTFWGLCLEGDADHHRQKPSKTL